MQRWRRYSCDRRGGRWGRRAGARWEVEVKKREDGDQQAVSATASETQAQHALDKQSYPSLGYNSPWSATHWRRKLVTTGTRGAGGGLCGSRLPRPATNVPGDWARMQQVALAFSSPPGAPLQDWECVPNRMANQITERDTLY